jgi:hypothetical protein
MQTVIRNAIFIIYKMTYQNEIKTIFFICIVKEQNRAHTVVDVIIDVRCRTEYSPYVFICHL